MGNKNSYDENIAEFLLLTNELKEKNEKIELVKNIIPENELLQKNRNKWYILKWGEILLPKYIYIYI